MTARAVRMHLPRGRGRMTRSFGTLLGVVTLLLGLGLMMVLSASSIDSYNSSRDFFGQFSKQAFIAVLAWPGMIVLSRMPQRTLRRVATPAYLVTLAMQAIVVTTGLGSSGGGNRNWLSIGGFTLQPSEFIKLTMVVWLARVMGEDPERLVDPRFFFRRVFLGVAGAVLLVALGHDMGTAVVIVLIAFGCWLVGRVPMRFLGLIGVVGGVLAAFGVLLSANRLSRVASWASAGDCTDYMGTCWQTTHGTWALAAGGVLGVGLGNSKSKWAWLPEAENDFIFAIIGEELGLIGAIVVILLYVALAVLLVRLIGRRAADPFDQIVLAGALVWVVGQAFINIAVVLGFLPVLGVPLPLVSYGGSSLLATMLMLGVVLGVADRDRPPVAVVGAGRASGGRSGASQRRPRPAAGRATGTRGGGTASATRLGRARDAGGATRVGTGAAGASARGTATVRGGRR
ncbi:MAG: Cell division protein FtsW [Pseudoclavibacter caeni]|jgi:cell division protein FtsW